MSGAHLQFLQGEQTLFTYRLNGGRTLIGRSDHCDVSLPSDNISRVHCMIDQKPDGWWLIDRSLNGTWVNGESVKRVRLEESAVLAFGDYTATFQLSAPRQTDGGSPTMPLIQANHEELVSVSDSTVSCAQAHLLCTQGPRQGQRYILDKTTVTLGGPGADCVLDSTLPPNAARARVVRGRIMICPGAVAVMLQGQRVREATPAHAGEEIRIGEHMLVVERNTEEQRVSSELFFGEMVGESATMRNLFGVLSRMAVHDVPVLLTGESGTGKELAARGLHDRSGRAEAPFIPVNCAGIPEALFESELFGHEKGAFTGAYEQKAGAFQRADGGTLFLDEVGELRIESQAKLLRALESGEVRRVGGAKSEYPDVRIVSATNRSLTDMVQAGTFRSDLFFRLSVLSVCLPPLRERPEDVALVARTLLQRNHPGVRLTDEAIAVLSGHHWPGNVRELRNVLTRAFVLGGPVIRAEQLSFHPWAFEDRPQPGSPMPAKNKTDERQTLLTALQRNNGNRSHTAIELGLPRSTLLYRLKKHGLDKV